MNALTLVFLLSVFAVSTPAPEIAPNAVEKSQEETEPSENIEISTFNPSPRLGDLLVRPLLDVAEDSALASACGRTINEREPCIELLRSAISEEPDPLRRTRLRFKLAHEYIRVNRPEEAIEHWKILSESYPLLAPYANYKLAEQAIQENRWNDALSLLEKVPVDSRFYTEAMFRRGECLVRLQRAEEAAGVFEQLLLVYPDHSMRGIALWELGQIYRGLNHPRAREMYEKLAKDFPETSYGQRAYQYLHGRPKNKMYRDIDQLRKEGDDLMKVFWYKSAYRKYNAARNLLGNANSRLRGEITLDMANAKFSNRSSSRRYTDAIYLAKQVLNSQATRDAKARARHLIVRSHLRKNEYDQAIREADRFLGTYPKHPLACDARYLAARAYQNAGNERAAVDHYIRVFEDFPTCKHADNAAWFAAWTLYRSEQYDRAQAVLRGIQRLKPDTVDAQQAYYWDARILAKQGQEIQAAKIWTALVERFPLSYYGMQALARLDEGGFERPDITKKNPRWVSIRLGDDLDLDIRKERANQGVRRAIEFTELGLEYEARREWKHLLNHTGFPDTLPWIASWSFNRVGNYQFSHWIPRIEYKDWTFTWPHPGQRSFWLLAYPRPYRDLVESNAAKSGIVPWFVHAIMREESSFQADVMSPAKALGLMQIIESTGRAIARDLGEESFEFDSLKQPETAIRFGAFHLGQLMREWDGRLPLAIASYNAGSAAVGRWVREHSDIALDEFIESIPYRETRLYTKRVLRTYGTYRYLYTEDKIGLDIGNSLQASPTPAVGMIP